MNRLIKLAACVAAVVTTAGGAEAAPLTLTMNDLTNGGSVSVADLDGDGIVSFDGAVGGFSLVVSVGISKPLAGNDAETAVLRLSNTSLASLLGGTLEILLTDTDFQVAPAGPATLESAIGGVTAGTITASQFVDLDNNEFGMVGANVTSLDHSAFSGAFSETLTGLLGYSGEPFSITERVLVTLNAGASSSFDFVSTLSAVPEPSSLALGLIAGIGGVLTTLRSRRRKNRDWTASA